MCSIDDCFCVLKERALEKHVREGNEQSRLVYRCEQSLKWNGDSVIGFNLIDAQASVTCMSLVDVHNRRKIQFRIDNLISLWRRLQTGKNKGLANRNILVHHDGAWI